ncbi:hypothetical protein E2C01_016139 [Portunus trituberculatus]|uniref:Uncharacterized protein n=1 Tax=Portunus trituberculatus TaxID=210409 RepID=A0A5B7DN99_PORTR|nr:hypothetical protein [Portunus trituberculatus]
MGVADGLWTVRDRMQVDVSDVQDCDWDTLGMLEVGRMGGAASKNAAAVAAAAAAAAVAVAAAVVVLAAAVAVDTPFSLLVDGSPQEEVSVSDMEDDEAEQEEEEDEEVLAVVVVVVEVVAAAVMVVVGSSTCTPDCCCIFRFMAACLACSSCSQSSLLFAGEDRTLSSIFEPLPSLLSIICCRFCCSCASRLEG